jgi:ribonuclease VapC
VSVVLALDSWILVAWLKDQNPGADYMASLWAQAERGELRLVVSILNIGEVFYLTARQKGVEAAEKLLAHLRERPLEFLPVPDSLVIEAARLKASYPIAFGDAFAAATAIRLSCPLATGDPELRRLEADGLLTLDWAG